MCGRAYHTYTDEELHLRYLNQKAKADPLSQKPNYNLAPTQISPIVFLKDGNLVIELFRWGLVPFWANDVKSADKYSMINARCEEIAGERAIRPAV